MVPISFFAVDFAFVRQDGKRRRVVEKFFPISANDFGIFRRQFGGNFFLLKFARHVKELGEKFFCVETVGDDLRNGHQHAEICRAHLVDRETNQRIIFKADSAERVHLKNFVELAVVFVGVNLRHVAEGDVKRDGGDGLNDFERARPDVAEIGAKVQIFFERLIHGGREFNRVDGTAYLVEHLL